MRIVAGFVSLSGMSLGRVLRSTFIVGVGATLFFAAATTTWAATPPQTRKADSQSAITELPKVKKPSGEDKDGSKGKKGASKDRGKKAKGNATMAPDDDDFSMVSFTGISTSSSTD